MATRRTKEVPIPAVTQSDMEAERSETVRKSELSFDRQYPLWTAGFRAALGDWVVSFQVSDGNLAAIKSSDADAIESLLGTLEDLGWVACNSPDNPNREPETPVRTPLQFPSVKSDRDDEETPTRRAGSRNRQSKGNALVLPFGKYRGETLLAVWNGDPDYVEWLAENATMPDVRKAAQKLVND